MSQSSSALADRLERVASALADCASALTDVEWQTRVPRNGLEIGAMVQHVASNYLQLAQTIAGGAPLAAVTGENVDEMNAGHARHDDVTQEIALDLLRRNSSAAAAAIRALSDEEMIQVAGASVYSDAPLECQ
jgi:hypothetical protein